MPRGDQTGPGGMGPMTGRGAGFCAGYDVPGYMNPGMGYGRGFGRGIGRQFRGGFGRGNQWVGRGYLPNAPYVQPPYSGYGYAQPPQTTDEIGMLKQQADYFKSALEDIQARLTELSKKDKQK